MPVSPFGMSSVEVSTVQSLPSSHRATVLAMLLAADEQSDRLDDLEMNSPLLASRSYDVILNLKLVIEQEQRLLKSLLNLQP